MSASPPSPPPTAREAAVFVSSNGSLRPGGGGVQRCTREYAAALSAGGYTLAAVGFDWDRRLRSRLLRKLVRIPYRFLLPAAAAAECAATARRAGARWIFLNECSTAPLAEAIAKEAPGQFRFALLSHGVDSTDYLHQVRIRGRPNSRTAVRLGRQLFAEAHQRSGLDVVFCLSEVDLAIEHWLGARRAMAVPRTIVDEPLALAPERGRVGMVATIDHAPNYEGIVRFAEALARHPAVTLRLIGRPAGLGEALARRFPQVAYLGVLDDAALAAEARTWTCFVNAIFCYGRGASTKLAVPLGWRMPIASTRAGARGYAWDESLVPLVDSPEALAARAAQLATLETVEADRQAVDRLAGAMPTIAAVGESMRRLLASVP